MGLELAAPLGLIGLVAVAAAVAVQRRHPPPLSRRAGGLSLGLRCALLAAVVLALAGLTLRLPAAHRTLVVVVDRSASLEGGLDQERALVDQLRGQLAPADRFAVVTFGADAQVEEPVVSAAASAFGDFTTRPNPNATDLESALRLAASLMPATTTRQIVVLSDGRPNSGDALTEAAVLRAAGVRVDVLPITVPAGPEVLLDSVHAPSTVPAAAGFQVRAILGSNVRTTTAMTVSVDGAVVASLHRAVPVGQSEVDLDLPPEPPGLHDVRVQLTPALDTFGQNNAGEILVQVLGPQRVLVVEGAPGEASSLAAALRAAGLEATVIAPAAVPQTAGDLGAYAAVALVDVSAQQLGTARMKALRQATENLAVGLSVFGGPDTLGPGGFTGTPLEAALPVTMQVRNPREKPPVAVVLVLESVESAAGDAVVRGAARALVEKLTPRDWIGVTDAISGLAVPLQQVGDRSAVERQITGIANFGDPPAYDPFIVGAEHALVPQAASVKHVILLGDGDAAAVSPQLIAALVAQGVTVSAVGVDIDGNPAQMAAMRQVAEEGRGRFYQSESADQVPDILLAESQTTLKPWLVQQPFRAQLGSPSALLAGIDAASLPSLQGYVATTAKAASQVSLYALDRDPLLARWQYGLGQAVVWTSDVGGRWASALLASAQGGRLLANAVQSTLPLASDPRLQLSATTGGTRAHLDLQAATLPDGAAVQVQVVSPGGAAATVPLVPAGGGRFEGDVQAADLGAYSAHVTATAAGRVVAATTTGFIVAYSPEYRFLGTDGALLAQVAARGGGVVLPSAGVAAAQVLPSRSVPVPLTPWLLMAAVPLLVADIALRRLAFAAGDAAVWAGALRRQAPARPAPVEATVGRLRRRVAGIRGGTGEAPAESPPVAGAPPVPDDAPAAPPEEFDLGARLLARRRR